MSQRVPVGGTVLVAGESLLVVDPPELAAYDAAAPDRAPRWRARVSDAAGWSAESTAGLLLITERGQIGQATATTARDAATGEERWRRPDRVYAAGEQAIAVTGGPQLARAGPAGRGCGARGGRGQRADPLDRPGLPARRAHPVGAAAGHRRPGVDLAGRRRVAGGRVTVWRLDPSG